MAARKTGTSREEATDAPPARTVGRAGAPAQGRELRARGKATMRKLLDAGIEVFATRGYHAARVDDIVKAARTSHGTFYLYFSNKEDLFQALVADVADELAALTDSLGALTPDRAGYEALRSWLEQFREVYARYGPIVRTWTEAEVGSSEAGRVGADLLGELAVAIARRATGQIDGTLDPAIASLALVAMIERFNYFVLNGQIDADPDTVLDTLAGVMHDALFGAP